MGSLGADSTLAFSSFVHLRLHLHLAPFIWFIWLLQCWTVVAIIIPVQVGRSGDKLALVFSPDNVTAAVGDFVQFQFYPVNHSVVQASFDAPCVPFNNSTSPGGFFSGFNPLPTDTKTLSTFTVPILTTYPIFFYCAQGRHCQQGFVGAINPTTQKSVAAFRAAAANAPYNLSPGEQLPSSTNLIPTDREPRSSDILTFSSSSSSSSSQSSTTTSSFGNGNVGAIVGGVLGGVVFLILSVSASVFWLARKRREKERRARQLKFMGAGRGRNRVAYRGAGGVVIGKPIVSERNGPFGVGRVAIV